MAATQTPLKISVLGKYLPPFFGGIESFVGDLCEGLGAKGHQVQLIGIDSGKKFYHQENYEIFALPSLGKISSQPLFWPSRKQMRNILQGSDVVIHNYPHPLMDFWAEKSLSKNTKNILVFHSEIHGRPHLQPAIKSLTRRNLERAEAIVVASPFHKYFSTLQEYKDKCLVLPFGTDLPEQIVEPKEDAILFVGRLVPYKGLQYLIAAMQSVSKKLIIVGTGPEERKLKKLVAKLRLEEKINFMGNVSESKLKSLYKDCLFSVLPSCTQAETFGLSLIEAMAHGRPVITTDIPTGVNFVNLNKVTGLCVPRASAEELANAINELINDKELRTRLGRNARLRAEGEFSKTYMLKRWSLLLDQVTHNQQPDISQVAEPQHRPAELT